MAVDKLVDSTQLNTDLTSVANAIRTKGGTSGQLAFPAGFVSAVQAIPTGTTPTGTKQIAITQNGTVTEDVAAYANAEIAVNVQGGGAGGVARGSVTVAERTRYLTIDMGGEYDHILVVQRSGTGNQYSQDGSRYTWALWGIRGYASPTNNPNAKGAFHTITNEAGLYGAFMGSTCCVFSGDSVTFDANGIAASNVAFSPYVTYDWWAW